MLSAALQWLRKIINQEFELIKGTQYLTLMVNVRDVA